MKLTKEEFLNKYGSVKVKFKSYYKYKFTYSGEISPGVNIFCTYGGDSDDIYRYSVDADEEQTVDQICPEEGKVVDNGVITDEFWSLY